MSSELATIAVAEAPPDPAAPRYATLREGRGAVIGLMLAALVVTLDNTVLNVALPSIARDLHAGNSGLQWITNAYSLLFGGLLLTGGNLADRLGRRRVLLWGLTAFGAASGLVLLVHSTGALIGLRAVLGAAAAFLMPSTLALLFRLFSGPARVSAIGMFGAVAASGFVLGPVVGGLVLDHFSWRAVFIINLPVAAAAILITARTVPESREPTEGGIDLVGAVLSVVTMLAFVMALISGPDTGWTSARVVDGFLVTVVGGTGFVRWELRCRYPMLPIRLLANKFLAGPAIAETAIMFSLSGVLFCLTQHLQLVEGHSPLVSGLMSAPAAAGLILGGTVVNPLLRRLGPARGSALAFVAGGGAFALIAAGLPHGYVWLALGLFLLGAVLRAAITTTALAVIDGLPPERAGMGSALNDTFQEVGNALGIAVLGAVLNARYRAGLPASAPAGARHSLAGALGLHDGELARTAGHAFDSGMQSASWAAAGVFAVVAVLCLRTVPGGLDISGE
jgi:EmrB/QacA subfamily drug resistance transporter